MSPPAPSASRPEDSAASADLRRRTVLAAPVAAAWPFGTAVAAGEGQRKILRVAFSSAETTFDPARIIDLYSRTITAHIFEALFGYDHLARPVKAIPVLADGMPQVSDDFKVWTIKVKRGIYFSDDPAFKGVKRELVAADVLYALKRLLDPANKSPAATLVIDIGVIGLAAVRKRALDEKKPFDYDAPVEGLQLLDSHTLRLTLAEARPRMVEVLASASILGAQAREAVEFYGDKVGEHPVGTGPFRLKKWVRGSKIILERNPQFREEVYDAQPAPDDTAGQAILARLKGKRIPLVDEVEVSVIQENQPMWLSFLNGQIDGLVANTGSVPLEFATQAAPGGKIAPNLAKRGIQLHRTVRSDMTISYFNMEDPIIGGYTPEKVALRRAISLSYDVKREITVVRRGQAVPAYSALMPGTSGYDPAFRSEMADYSVQRANALLDMYGYLDRNGDGFRETPDGKPIKLKLATEPEQIYRDFNELWRRAMKSIGIEVEFAIAQWPENMKSALAGSLQMWMLGSSASAPDGQPALAQYYGPEAGQQNLARFKLAEFDKIYDRLQALPDGEERNRLFHEAKRLTIAYMPYKVYVHRIANELTHPWVIGYRRALFWSNWWHMVDVDSSQRQATT